MADIVHIHADFLHDEFHFKPHDVITPQVFNQMWAHYHFQVSTPCWQAS
jgi:hypothetical protein